MYTDTDIERDAILNAILELHGEGNIAKKLRRAVRKVTEELDSSGIRHKAYKGMAEAVGADIQNLLAQIQDIIGKLSDDPELGALMLRAILEEIHGEETNELGESGYVDVMEPSDDGESDVTVDDQRLPATTPKSIAAKALARDRAYWSAPVDAQGSAPWARRVNTGSAQTVQPGINATSDNLGAIPGANGRQALVVPINDQDVRFRRPSRDPNRDPFWHGDVPMGRIG